MTQKLGILYGVSVGTGDPELITVKGLKLLQNASIVAFPAGINNQLGVAERIIQPWLIEKQIKLPLNFPYVLDENLLEKAWKTSAEIIWPYLEKG